MNTKLERLVPATNSPSTTTFQNPKTMFTASPLSHENCTTVTSLADNDHDHTDPFLYQGLPTKLKIERLVPAMNSPSLTTFQNPKTLSTASPLSHEKCTTATSLADDDRAHTDPVLSRGLKTNLKTKRLVLVMNSPPPRTSKNPKTLSTASPLSHKKFTTATSLTDDDCNHTAPISSRGMMTNLKFKRIIPVLNSLQSSTV
mmetsp:Transcript_5303/g.6624  ORF Transcript_5303/g.6624 Transcript_5303/m.6624 type:complete len:201 (-) Transcript_5303:20-622(-)